MKRSEMIKLMEKHFYHSSSGTRELKADRLLKEMEEAGMLPPSRENPVFRKASSFAIQYEQIPHMINTWEPEDEEG